MRKKGESVQVKRAMTIGGETKIGIVKEERERGNGIGNEKNDGENAKKKKERDHEVEEDDPGNFHLQLLLYNLFNIVFYF